MERVYQAGAVVLPPAAPITPSVGYPTGGDPLGGTPATLPGAYWFHMITEELRAIVSAGGLTPDHSVLNQVLQALPAALASRPEMARVLGTAGYQKLPGGLILQWGTATGPINTTAVVTLPLAFTNTFRQVFISVRDTVQNVASNPLGGAVPSTLSSFTIRNFYTASTLAYSYFAIGD